MDCVDGRLLIGNVNALLTLALVPRPRDPRLGERPCLFVPDGQRSAVSGQQSSENHVFWAPGLHQK